MTVWRAPECLFCPPPQFGRPPWKTTRRKLFTPTSSLSILPSTSPQSLLKKLYITLKLWRELLPQHSKENVFPTLFVPAWTTLRQRQTCEEQEARVKQFETKIFTTYCKEVSLLTQKLREKDRRSWWIVFELWERKTVTCFFCQDDYCCKF